MSRPALLPDDLDCGGGGFFLASFVFLEMVAAFLVGVVSWVVAERVGRGGPGEGGGAELGVVGAPGRYCGMEEVGRGGAIWLWEGETW